MSYFTKAGLLMVLGVILFNCAPKSMNYDLPSANAEKTPQWVGTHRAARDTIYIMISLPDQRDVEMAVTVQKAQSELHGILVNEIELILRDYWDETQMNYTDDEMFQLLSSLPITLEMIMNHVTVSDGWNRSDNVAILCAIDYEKMAQVLMEDMQITDRAFLSHLKRHMDELAQRYR